MDKNLVTFVGAVLIIAFVFFAAMNALFLSGPNVNAAATLPKNDALPAGGEAQVVNLSAKGINYTPSTITVKQNQPVKLVADLKNLRGCLKAINIPAFGIKKIFSDSDNVLEFTPTQKGTFEFSCFMGMGRGTLIVV